MSSGVLGRCSASRKDDFQTSDRKAPQPIGGGFSHLKVTRSLYIKLEVGQTIKGDIEKIYLVCYPIFEKKETFCKEIV